MAKKIKFYVVWQGKEPGIYSNWDACKKQVDGFEGAQYKSFPTKAAAELAYSQSYYENVSVGNNNKKPLIPWQHMTQEEQPLQDTLSVDAACSGNPGRMEYRGVDVMTGAELFRQGPYEEGTNNVGEFLALVHGLALLKQMDNNAMPIYSDSKIAMSWITQKKCKTKLVKTANNTKIFELIQRAEKWLQENTFPNKILKWQTKTWGEIPADFGRK